MIRTLTTAAAATALLACAVPAAAQDPAPASGSWTFVVGAATDNRSKAASKTDGDAFVWGEAEWESASGMFYAGPSFETIKSSGSELEVALNAGVRPEFAGFDLDLNVKHKWQIDANPGADADAWEFTADVKRSIGPASGRIRLQYSPDSTGATEAWTWTEARLGWDFTDKLYASAAIGRREQDNSVDYTGYDVGLNYALTRNLEAELRWYGTDADVPGEQYADSLVAGVSLAF
ncbi:TorF family putative porin [Roseibacterium beibuensis]|uniref:TorF family putative porin n=1 Tax=[Roseibacterium] beibuensis TaxID=1193142 RepID=UPI00217D8BBD|nr:TorF family putative porin [Roseibacterium beibuensis]MCS6625592.1 TorF family putative porin [Roseibacterium beibuensis]